MRHRTNIWQVLLENGNVQLNEPLGSRVVGVAVGARDGQQPGLLLLAPDRRSFNLLISNDAYSMPVARASEDVVQAAASHGLPVLAWLTVKGELVVWSIHQGHTLYRAAPEEGA
jgi:hypothetical protein